MTIPRLQPRRIRRRCAVARGKSGSQNTDHRGETEERCSDLVVTAVFEVRRAREVSREAGTEVRERTVTRP